MENRISHSTHPFTMMFLIDVFDKMGGAERNLIMLAEHLRKRGYKIIIFCLKGGELADGIEHRGFSVEVLNLNRIYGYKGIMAVFKMIQFMRREKVSLLMTYHESSDFLGLLIAIMTNTPIISNRRDMGFKLSPRHIRIYRIINRLFDHIVTVSHAVMQSVKETQGARPQKISVIQNGSIPVGARYEERPARIKGVEFTPECANICCLANIRPIKGQKTLMSAAHIVSKNFPMAHFFFVGATDLDRAYYAELMQQKKDLSLETSVFFTGQLEPSQVPGFLSQMDICVLPSLSEGMSNTLLEYMALGKSVVATAVGGNPELVEDGKTGLLVPPNEPEAMADAILRLLNDQKLRSAMGMRARDRLEREFSATRMVDKYEKLMKRVYFKKNLGERLEESSSGSGVKNPAYNNRGMIK